MRKTTVSFDHNEKKLYRLHEEDVEPLLDSLKEERNHNDSHHVKNRAGWKKIGEIPMVIIDKWFKEGFNALEDSPEARKELKRRLNGDYKYLRATNNTL
jgi:hypothetical protein